MAPKSQPRSGKSVKEHSRWPQGAALSGLAVVLSGCQLCGPESLMSGCGSSPDRRRASEDAGGLGCRSMPMTTLGDLGSNASCKARCDEQQDCHVWSYDFGKDLCTLREYCELFTWGEAGVEVGWKPHLPQPITCTRPEKGICCPGHDIKVLPQGSFTDCCASCHSTPGCMLFQLEAGACHLKSGCPAKTGWPAMDGCDAVEVGWMQRPGAASFPKPSDSPYYKVGRGWMNITGYQCGDGYPATAIWYPIGRGPFGVVVHRVGTGGQLDMMDEWFVTMASLGIIVLAPFTGEGTCHGSAWADMLRVVEAVYEDGLRCEGCDVPPGGLDFQKVAFSGHSMGAMGAMTDAYSATRESKFPYADQVSVRAIVSAHDVGDRPEKVPEDVAVFVCGGSLDWTMPSEKVDRTYRQLDTKAKVGASMFGAGHNEPGLYIEDGMGNGARENWWMSVFLACHVGPAAMQKRHCDTIYGDGPGSMFATQSWELLLRQHPDYSPTQIELDGPHDQPSEGPSVSDSFVA